MGNVSGIKSIVIFFVAIVIAFCSMFVVVNADKIFPNNNVEQIEPGDDNVNEDDGTETPGDNESSGAYIYITLSENHIKF